MEGALHRAATGLLAGVVLLCAGCLVQRDRTVRVHGQELSEVALAQIRQGVTTRAELIDTLGPPTRVYTTGRGTEVLVYEYRRDVHSSTQVFLLLSSNSSKTHITTHKFEVEDGVVLRQWTESTG